VFANSAPNSKAACGPCCVQNADTVQITQSEALLDYAACLPAKECNYLHNEIARSAKCESQTQARQHVEFAPPAALKIALKRLTRREKRTAK